MTAPKEIIELVERFENNLEEYRSGRYNETELRRDFVDPFFKALGWDVGNKGGRSELYREVVHEDSVKVRGSTKAPDYGFYVGGARKFFVEAKKPSVNLENDVKAAFQLRSYAWSAGLSISLLTDFEEFSIYDCRIEPANSDSPKVALLRHFTYDKYIDHWDQIAALFSREAVLGGSLERFIESRKRKKGTITVDEAFLREIDHWREILAKNVHKNNLNLTVRELNSSVQNTIDRIVFLRICEDRGIERDERLKDLLKGERAIYTMLVEQFRQADEKYNSGLFHFKKDNSRHGEPDELALSLKIDDEVLSEMIENLYPPKSPYRFSVIPAEILGHVYEQFLGKVISLGEDGEVEVEYKPEVRKAGGVYYTPTYIVEYIVENTVGKLLEGQTPTSASSLRILDPACGSGSFLIGAYQKLLDWHLGWYADHLVPLLEAGASESSKEVRALLPESYSATANAGAGAGGAGNGRRRGRGRPRKSNASSAANAANAGQFPIIQVQGGDWRLTTAERKRILLNNIHGVDIDLQATEVTKLSLQLKVLEGENQETLSRQLTLFHQRALPDLGENIKCGNSLIGPDFYDGQTSLFDEEEMYRVNAFDWEAEFPEIMGRGGFDAVIGNPPYLSMENMDSVHRDYYYGEENGNRRFSTAMHKSNTYSIFWEKSIQLTKDNSFAGLITPYSWLSNSSFINMRKLFLFKTKINELILLPIGVFKSVGIATSILILQKIPASDHHIVKILDLREVHPREVSRHIDACLNQKFIPTGAFRNEKDMIFNMYWNENRQLLLSKIDSQSRPLGEFVSIDRGCDPASEEKYTGYELKENSNSKRLLRGKNIGRYSHNWDGSYLYYLPDQMKAEKSTARPGEASRFEVSEKLILYRFLDTLKRFIITYDSEQHYCLGSNYVAAKRKSTNMDLRFIMAILNSNLITFYNRNLFKGVKLTLTEMKRLPICNIDLSDPEDSARHDKMVSLVENMLDLHWRLSESKTGHEKTLLSRQIEATDRQIDGLVYELYGLSEEEIAIVEDAAR